MWGSFDVFLLNVEEKLENKIYLNLPKKTKDSLENWALVLIKSVSCKGSSSKDFMSQATLYDNYMSIIHFIT